MQNDQNAAITVVVPTFRRPRLLRECLLSLKQQTFREFRVLVCDNSPTREAEPVVEQLADARFEYHPRPANLGIFGNAIAGFRTATSPFVMEVDDDDFLYPDAMELLIEPLLRYPEVTLSFGDINVVSADGRHITEPERSNFVPPRFGLQPGLTKPFTHLAAQGRIYMVAALLRAASVDWDTVPSDVATSYDRYLALVASRGARPAWYVNHPVAAYRVHATADGMRHSWIQLAGAMAALNLELEHMNTAQDRSVLEFELLRTRFMLGRAIAAEHGWFSILRAFFRETGSRKATSKLFHLAATRLGPIRPRGKAAAFGLEHRRRKIMSNENSHPTDL